eukprot:Phypoly_transcript_06418.p1 GENE.Phypoly_transcript_06418~~Phypoly_transcript_06418.p1  ORF type:complete len:436 (+),score=40.61 Phypoly_transcript_06418:399-1706(+)
MTIGDNCLEERTKAQICDDLVASLPSASVFARNNDSHAWRKNTNATRHIKAHRTTSDIPVVLLDSVLSDLYDDIVGKKYKPTPKDCTHAVTLMEGLSQGFDDEASMLKFLLGWAETYGWTLVQHGNADANWIVDERMLLNLEVKNEKGSGGGCSYMLNINYYIKHWANHKIAALESLCPTILLEITGPEIAVNGAVFSNSGILCDPFFSASLLCNEYDYHHMCTVARIIGAISKAIGQLKAKREAPHDGFPWFRHIQTAKGEKIRIEYKSNIKNKHLIFRAEQIQESGQRCQVVVKFTPMYGTAAHIVCEKAGCAPALFHVSTVCHFTVVVMEYIDKAVHWNQITDEQQKTEAKKKIKTAMDKLHSEGIVHGDLRATNILVADDRVAVIDFDWSGPTTAEYPFFMNPEIVWPEGVHDGAKLAVEHDEAWISRDFL